jgi:hypothetical protein
MSSDLFAGTFGSKRGAPGSPDTELQSLLWMPAGHPHLQHPDVLQAMHALRYRMQPGLYDQSITVLNGQGHHLADDSWSEHYPHAATVLDNIALSFSGAYYERANQHISLLSRAFVGIDYSFRQTRLYKNARDMVKKYCRQQAIDGTLTTSIDPEHALRESRYALEVAKTIKAVKPVRLQSLVRNYISNDIRNEPSTLTLRQWEETIKQTLHLYLPSEQQEMRNILCERVDANSLVGT